jgi:hypothetical protein
MEHNAQIKEMEAELERLIKEKEQATPMEVIPLSAIPIIGVITVTKSTATTTELPSVSPLTTLEIFVEIARSMEEMTLQESTIKRLEKEVENLQELKYSFQASYNRERSTSEKLK